MSTDDPHADGYRPDLETNPMRAATYALGTLLMNEMSRLERKLDRERAMTGDLSGLSTSEIAAIRVIRHQLGEDSGQWVTDAAYRFVSAVAGGIRP